MSLGNISKELDELAKIQKQNQQINKSLDEIIKIMQEHNKKQDELTKEYGW